MKNDMILKISLIVIVIFAIWEYVSSFNMPATTILPALPAASLVPESSAITVASGSSPTLIAPGSAPNPVGTVLPPYQTNPVPATPLSDPQPPIVANLTPGALITPNAPIVLIGGAKIINGFEVGL